MRLDRKRVLFAGIAAIGIGVYAEIGISAEKDPLHDATDAAVKKGIQWLVSVQGKDGGWGQDGGETSYVREGERLESNGNDVANTAVAAEALLKTGNSMTEGPYRENLKRAVDFILAKVEASPVDGLAVTNLHGTQIERKLGPYIDTFLSAKLLGDLDGDAGSAAANARVRKDLQKCLAKIEANQLKDGSWNIAGAWAPIFGTSIASQSLATAQAKGVAVNQLAMARVDEYTQLSSNAPVRAKAAMAPTAAPAPAAPPSGAVGGTAGGVVGGIMGGVPLAAPPPPPAAAGGYGSGSGGGIGSGSGAGVGPGTPPVSAIRPSAAMTYPAPVGSLSASSAGVSLYKRAQELEQITRTGEDRMKNAAQIKDIETQLSDPRFVTGFGSVGGEEFFSYLNISDSLHRAGGPQWDKWNADMKAKILQMQNADGTWAGHHCITGRVAVTSAAILNLLVDRDPLIQPMNFKKKK
jgi:hypothetical protein